MRASSWRSSKSSADSRVFACPYRSANSVRSSCRSARSRAAASSRAACSTAPSASQYAGGAVAACLEAGQVHEPVGTPVAVDELEQLGRRPLLGVGGFRIGGERGRGRAQLVDPLSELRPRGHREIELASRRAERLVHARQHPPQPVAPVGRKQLEPLRLVPGAELRERLAERLRPEHGRLCLVELAEMRVEPGGERIRPEEAGTEAVDRRDPGAVELTREVVPATPREGGANPRPQLARRAPRIRDDEDRVDVEPALCHRTDDPLDEHGRLAGAGAGGDEDLTSRLDRGELLMVQLIVQLVGAHARSIRQTVQRSHQAGHSPPSGSWRTSPSRIRSASAVAVLRADSTTPQNASSSR